MIDPVLQVWSGPRCELGAEAFAPIPGEVKATITETVGGSDDAGSLTLPRHIALAAGFDEGRVLRAHFTQRGVVEWLVLRVVDSSHQATTSVTLAPLRQLLALRGLVRVTTGADTSLELPAFDGTIEEVLQRRVYTHLAEDRLEWLQPGVIDPAYATQRYTWPAQSNVRRGEVLTLVEQVTGLEVALRRLAGDTGYAVDVLSQRHGDKEPRLLRGVVQDLTRTRDLLQTATQVAPIGDDGQPMGEVDWEGGASIGSGPWWIPLVDPTGGDAPIQEDGQCVGMLLALPDGTTLPVLDSRASDSAVQVASRGTYVAGQRVVFWEAASGRTVTRLDSPRARAKRHLVTATATVKGARRERTRNRNPAFVTNTPGWTPGTHGTLIDRSDFDVSFGFLADGARAGGTGTGTPFTVKNAGAGRRFYRGDTVQHTGAVLTTSAAVLPTTSGGFTVPFTTGLPASFADNDAITLRRHEQVMAPVLIGTPRGAPRLFLNVGDADLAQRWTAFARCDQYGGLFVPGDVRALGPGSVAFDNNWYAMHVHADDATLLVVRCGSVGGGVTTPVSASNVQVLSAHRIRVTVPDHTITGTVNVPFKWDGGGTQLPDWIWASGGGLIMDLLGDIVGGGVSGGFDYIDIDIIGLPAATSLIGLAGYVADFGSGQKLYQYPPGITWSGSFNLTWLHESRELRFQGAHSGGAMSATFKDIAALARRNWIGGDTLYTAGAPYAVGGGAAWATTGIASVPITLPSGVTLHAGERVWSNWHGSPIDSKMVVATTVTGPASSVSVRGGDAYPYNWDGVASPSTACYRIPASATLEIFGNTLHIADNAVADGTGNASLTLLGVNANLIANNAALTLTRPPMIPPTERNTGYALRTLHAAGSNPPAPNLGVPSGSAFILVPPGEIVPVTATARAVVQPGTLHVGSAPMVALCHAVTGAVLGTGTISGSTTYDALTVLEITCTAELAASAWVHLRLTGGSNVDLHIWHIVLDAQFYVGREKLPVFDGARARLCWHRGQQVLKQRASSARYVVRAIDTAALMQDGEPVAPGQPARLSDDALGIDEVQRIVRLQWAFPSGVLIEAECAAIQPRLTDVTVNV